jgi:hypothetical protein
MALPCTAMLPTQTVEILRWKKVMTALSNSYIPEVKHCNEFRSTRRTTVATAQHAMVKKQSLYVS